MSSILLTLVLAACGPSGESGGKVDFVSQVKPILQSQCVRCHNDRTIMGGLNLMNRELAYRGSKNGPVLVPGDPGNSAIYRVTLLPEDQDHAMPATGAKLTEDERKILHRWITEGAEWPEGPDGAMAPMVIDPQKA